MIPLVLMMLSVLIGSPDVYHVTGEPSFKVKSKLDCIAHFGRMKAFVKAKVCTSRIPNQDGGYTPVINCSLYNSGSVQNIEKELTRICLLCSISPAANVTLTSSSEMTLAPGQVIKTKGHLTRLSVRETTSLSTRYAEKRAKYKRTRTVIQPSQMKCDCFEDGRYSAIFAISRLGPHAISGARNGKQFKQTGPIFNETICMMLADWPRCRIIWQQCNETDILKSFCEDGSNTTILGYGRFPSVAVDEDMLYYIQKTGNTTKIGRMDPNGNRKHVFRGIRGRRYRTLCIVKDELFFSSKSDIYKYALGQANEGNWAKRIVQTEGETVEIFFDKRTNHLIWLVYGITEWKVYDWNFNSDKIFEFPMKGMQGPIAFQQGTGVIVAATQGGNLIVQEDELATYYHYHHGLNAPFLIAARSHVR